MYRRYFLELLAGLPAAGKLTLIDGTPIVRPEAAAGAKAGLVPDDTGRLLVPARLKRGDTVAFTAPASPITSSHIADYVNFFKAQGCNVVIGDTIRRQTNRHRYLSAPDSERAAELNAFISASEVRAIICGRGGYGVMRILPFLDYEALRSDPKFIMGYSDITALLLAVYRCSNIISLHGPVGSSRLTAAHMVNLENVFFKDTLEICYDMCDVDIVGGGVSGKFRGQLQGGNLSLVAATMGTPYEIDLSDGVFFFEDTQVEAHEVDRMLTSLWLGGKFDSCRGVIVGKMKDLDKRGSFYPNRAFTIREVITEFAEKLKIPCVFGASFGHVSSELIFPLGAEVMVDGAKGRVSAQLRINSRGLPYVRAPFAPALKR